MKKKKSSKKNIKKTITIPQHKLFPKVNIKLNPLALAYTLSLLCPLILLTITLIAKFTPYLWGAVNILQNFFFTYNLNPFNIITGMAETAIQGIILGLAFGYLYNKLN